MRPAAQRLADPAELAEFAVPPEWPALTADEVREHGPDASYVVREGGDLRARCSVWWTSVPTLVGHRLGVVGHYGAADGAAARLVLDAACAELARRGCTLAVGPMDGNTWRRYRLVVDRGSEPPFFLEPANPDTWPGHWADAGFTALAHYSSALNTDLSRRDARAPRVAERLTATGVRVRTLDLARFDAELRRIYAVSAVSFQSNYLYTPLPEAHFTAQYQRVRPAVRPDLVLIAEHEGRPVGFAFTVPDLLERQRGAPARTVIVKTVATLPERRYAGLGGLMVDLTHEAARAAGFTRAVHALMHEANSSRRTSDRTGAPMRRYALFARPLA